VKPSVAVPTDGQSTGNNDGTDDETAGQRTYDNDWTPDGTDREGWTTTATTGGHDGPTDK
jgi:hypothetical protein